MSIKVSHLRLGMNIPDFERFGGKVAHIVDENTMEYIDKSNIISYVKHNTIKTGLTLSTYEDYLIVSNGYYVNSNNELISINQPYTYKFKSDDALVIGQIDGQNIYKIWIYHDGTKFIVQDFETNSMKFIGIAEYCGKWTLITPIEDLATSFRNRFLLSEIKGRNGFRVYSDGWKEQWGYGTNPTFYVTFNSIPTLVTNGASNITQKGMTISQGYWYAEGY